MASESPLGDDGESEAREDPRRPRSSWSPCVVRTRFGAFAKDVLVLVLSRSNTVAREEEARGWGAAHRPLERARPRSRGGEVDARPARAHERAARALRGVPQGTEPGRRARVRARAAQLAPRAHAPRPRGGRQERPSPRCLACGPCRLGARASPFSGSVLRRSMAGPRGSTPPPKAGSSAWWCSPSFPQSPIRRRSGCSARGGHFRPRSRTCSPCRSNRPCGVPCYDLRADPHRGPASSGARLQWGRRPSAAEGRSRG